MATNGDTLLLGGETPVLAVWGGIGFTRRPLKELRDLYALYTDDLSDFLRHCAGIFREVTAKENDGSPDSLQQNLVEWVEDRSRRAPTLEQGVQNVVTSVLLMARWIILCKRLGKTPGEVARSFSAFAGHSVGMTIAACMAMADSWESLYDMADLCLTGMYYGGHLVETAWENGSLVSQAAASESIRRGEGAPSAMLSVTGIEQTKLVEEMEHVNRTLSADRKLYLALINHADSFVAAGGPEGLVALCGRLRTLNPPGPLGADPQGSRCSLQFVPSGYPFHSVHLRGAAKDVRKRLAHIKVRREQALAPVWGLDSIIEEEPALANDMGPAIIEQSIWRQVDWPKTLEAMTGRWQVLDFGPGGFNGIGTLIQKMKAGSRSKIYTVCPADHAGRSSVVNGPADLLAVMSTDMNPQRFAHSRFEESQESSVSQSDASNQPRFTQVLGLPPVLVAGMTPTTCDVDLVAAIMNAGYYVEFATGGYHNASELSSALRKLAAEIPDGRLITVNIIYANPQGLTWMIPELASLIRAGLPIGGLTIGAGVPTAEVATEWIKTLELSYIGFKPANVTAIHQVLEIAKLHPTLPVLLQWTGGRAGGHHSSEDFHQPILETYQAIRDAVNVLLVGGSGFGDVEGSWPYMSGEWSRTFGQTPMPFDAILLGTCVMTTLEAKTSLEGKKAMVDAFGVPDEAWTGTLKHPTGGVISITSHLGEPMHVLATRGMRLWAELEKVLFKQPKEKMLQTLESRKSYFISRLNKDYQKPWFGFDFATDTAVDLADMTYFGVLRRLLELLHPARKGDWTDPSFRLVFEDFLIRTCERFGSKTEAIVGAENLSPQDQLKTIAAEQPDILDRLLSVEDHDFFLGLCKLRGRKPVPFIPNFDSEFPIWFKKDPLWQAESLESTYHGDVGRVCILCGPVALQYCKEFNQPVGVFLDSIHQGFIHKGLNQGAIASTQSPCFYQQQELIQAVGAAYVVSEADAFRLVEDSPESLSNEHWLLLVGSRLGLWGQRLFAQRKLVGEGRCYKNPVRNIFAARPGAMIKFLGKNQDGYSTAEYYSSSAEPLKVDASISLDGDKITVTVVSRCNKESEPLEYKFKLQYDALRTHVPIYEIMENRNDHIIEYYRAHVFGLRGEPVYPKGLVIKHPILEINREEFLAWQRAVDGQGLDVLDHMGPSGEVPIEYLAIQVMYVNWRHLFTLGWDISRLVHQHTMVKMREGQRMLAIGDKLHPVSQITSLTNRDSGIEVGFRMIITRNGEHALDLIYRFNLLGQRMPEDECFELGEPSTWIVNLRTEADVQALLAKPWLLPSANTDAFAVGKALLFEVRRDIVYKAGSYVTETSGRVWEHDPDLEDKEDMTPAGQIEEVGACNSPDHCTDYMKRHGTRFGGPVRLQPERKLKPKTGRSFKLTTPDNSDTYALVSGDINPIHTTPSFARFAGFQTPIYHGNQTAALTLQMIRRQIPGASTITLRRYECTFPAVVLAGDKLTVELKHVAMDKGSPVISFAVRRDLTDELVLQGEITLDAAPTAFLFTGQGSQFVGMGLDMISESRPARLVWQEADDYFEQNWGFSISSVVKQNPTRLTVNFCSRQGMKVRQNYLDAQDMLNSGSSTRDLELFKGLNSKSRSHTFHHQDGLLSMTQFAQPAIFVMEKAAFEHLRSLDRVAPGSQFAGHSLGEFAALGCMTSILPTKAALRTVFIRGALMQSAVHRDSNGRSGFAMAAVDPSRISKECGEHHLLFAVTEISALTGLLLEMVNFNVRGQQYVCAGDKRCIDILKKVTDALHFDSSLLGEESIKGLVAKHCQTIGAEANGLTLSRGKALVPLNGIDVPFHSSLLAHMREHFRRTLTDGIQKDEVKPEALEGMWIPNVTGKPFSFDPEYLETVSKLQGAHRIKELAHELQLLA